MQDEPLYDIMPLEKRVGVEAERRFKASLKPQLKADFESVRLARDYINRAAAEVDRALHRVPALYPLFCSIMELPDCSEDFNMSRVALDIEDLFVLLKNLQWFLQEEYAVRDEERKQQKRSKKMRHSNRTHTRKYERGHRHQQQHGVSNHGLPNHRRVGYQVTRPAKFRGLLKASFPKETQESEENS